MPHQHHFLSRLDRVNMPQVERALALYRDHELVRYLLGRLSLPEAAPRVAISLDHAERGPFLIVTREGRFVTCLGEGMTPGRLPIVTRERLEGVAAKHGDLRTRAEAHRALDEGKGRTHKLLSRLYHAGEDFSREEMFAASGLAPLLRVDFLRLLSGVAPDLASAREQILGVLRRTDKPNATYRDLLEAYYKTFWCAVHLTVLIAVDGRELFDQVDEKTRRSMRTFLTSLLFEHAIVTPAARAIWSVGKLGRSFLPNYKEAYAEATSALEVIETALSLSAIGHRHARLRAEVRKVVDALPPRFGRDPANENVHGFATGIVELCDLGFASPEAALLGQRRAGAGIAVATGCDLPPGSPYRFEREEDVPDTLALPLAVNIEETFLGDFHNLGPLVFALPWIARAKAEDLYLPCDYLAAIHVPWTPEHTLCLFRETASLRKQVARTPREGPTRNGPCPCGSRKKYKRCCGAARP